MKFFNTPFLSYVYDTSKSGYWGGGTNLIHYMYVNIPRNISITIDKNNVNNFQIYNKPMMSIRFFSNGFCFEKQHKMIVIDNAPNPDKNTSRYHRNQQLIMDKYSEIVNHLYCK